MLTRRNSLYHSFCEQTVNLLSQNSGILRPCQCWNHAFEMGWSAFGLVRIPVFYYISQRQMPGIALHTSRNWLSLLSLAGMCVDWHLAWWRLSSVKRTAERRGGPPRQWALSSYGHEWVQVLKICAGKSAQCTQLDWECSPHLIIYCSQACQCFLPRAALSWLVILTFAAVDVSVVVKHKI